MARVKAPAIEYITAAVEPTQYPSSPLPEFAVIGRSNVGKSSLINTLTGRKNIARISKTPGKTRLLHFYRFGHLFMLVDLPGYGFANVPAPERNKWDGMASTYLTARHQLRQVLLLLDARIQPTPLDHRMVDWLNFNAVPWSAVLTKIDKLSRNSVAGTIAKIGKNFVSPFSGQGLVPFSSVTGLGKQELIKKLIGLTGNEGSLEESDQTF